MIISSNTIQPGTKTNVKAYTQNSFAVPSKSLSYDQFIYKDKSNKTPIKFTGLGYFFHSSKGRQDLSEYLKSYILQKQTFIEPEEVILPDLKKGQKIDRIVLHWSATKKITPGCLTRYHYVIDNRDNSKIHEGRYSILDNAIKINDNNYAAHINQGNSHSVGISMVGMKGASSENFDSKNPINEIQFEKACKLIALMAIKYNLKITPDSITTHYEYGVRKNDKNKEKIDIQHLPWKPELKPDEIGSYIRKRVNNYIENELSTRAMRIPLVNPLTHAVNNNPKSFASFC